MAAPRVRVFLKGRQLDEVPFSGDVLRIGRMRENDVVIQNLSVSRFHATLQRDGDRIVLKDAGSENGCYVNGARVSGSVTVGPGDEILLGKHELRIVPGDGDADDEDAPAAVDHGRNDAWDGSATYVVGVDTQASMLAAAAPPPTPAADEHEETAQEEVSAAELFGDDDAEERAHLQSFDVSEEDLAPSVAEVGAEGDEAPLDLEPEEAHPEPPAAAALEEPEEPTSELDGPEPAGDATRRLFAGLILQRAGRFVRVMSWDQDRMTLGRATDCDIVLATAEVSRHHAMLVKEGGHFEVRDLESINGTFVNGEKVSRRTLEVGDVIRLDDYEMTFVVEDRPIADEIKTEAPAPPEPASHPDTAMMTQLTEVSDLAPFALDDAPADDAGVLSFDDPPAEEVAASGDLAEGAASEELEPALAMGFEPFEEPTMLVDDDDDEKELEDAPAASGVLAFDVRVRLEELPPRLRQALADLDEDDLRLPVELRLRTED